MSAKAFYHKSPPLIPALEDVPPEIWSTIIQYASQSGSGLYEYEMTPSEHTDFIRGEDISQMRVFFANFRTRSCLSRVNKAWYAMAAPFLFEYIHLANGRKISSLCEAILRSKEAAASNGLICPFGWWTKRLDLSMREPNDNLQATVAQLVPMVACFPNLRILTCSATGHGYGGEEMMAVLNVISAPRSLKAIHWHNLFRWPPDVWTKFLERHPGLQSVLGPGYVNIENKIVLDSVIALRPYPLFPLHSPTKNVELVACPMPSLCSLSGSYNQYLHNKYLQTVQKQLSIVELNLASYALLCGTLTEGGCPNLIQINIYISRWEDFEKRDACALSLSKSLETLGLSIDQVQIPFKEMQRLLRDVFPIFMSSKIRTIRFIKRQNVMALKRHHRPSLADGVRRLAKLGLVLKDHNSRPLLE